MEIFIAVVLYLIAGILLVEMIGKQDDPVETTDEVIVVIRRQCRLALIWPIYFILFVFGANFKNE